MAKCEWQADRDAVCGKDAKMDDWNGNPICDSCAKFRAAMIRAKFGELIWYLKNQTYLR